MTSLKENPIAIKILKNVVKRKQDFQWRSGDFNFVILENILESHEIDGKIGRRGKVFKSVDDRFFAVLGEYLK
jgi:hypothetical protein